VKLHAAATVRRDSAGKLHIKERGDVDDEATNRLDHERHE